VGGEVKLGVIRHIRCGEDFRDRTLVWLPDDMSEEAFAAAVEAARANYLEFVVMFEAVPPPNDYRPLAPIPFERYPSCTVAQVQADWAKKKAAWDTWNAERQQARKSFGDYIAGGRDGIKRFHEFDPPFEHSCDWGHQHGVSLDYDETEYDWKG
jgi:hypothetical protein